MLPDLKGPPVERHARVFQHDLSESAKIRLIQLCLIEAFSAFFNQRVIVISLFEVEIVLAVVRVGRDELTTDSPVDFPQDRFYLREQVVSGDPAKVLDAWLIETQPVAQFFRS